MEEKQLDVLGDLYTLRAGLSVISQEYDKAKNIEEITANDIGKSEEGLMRALPSLSEVSLKFNKYYQTHTFGVQESEFDKEKVETALDKREMLSLKQTTKENLNTYMRGLLIQSIILILGIAAIITFIALGVSNLRIGNKIFILFFILAVGVAIVSFLWHVTSAGGLCYYLSWVSKTKGTYKQFDIYLDKLDKHNEKAELLTTDKNAKIDTLRKECEPLYEVLANLYNGLLDIRDWENLDYIIYCIETRRADSIKEALQLVDREMHTQRIEKAIQLANQQICKTLAIGFTALRDTIENGFNSVCVQIANSAATIASTVSSRVAQLTSAVNMNNALQAKANITSEKLMRDVNTMCNYIES